MTFEIPKGAQDEMRRAVEEPVTYCECGHTEERHRWIRNFSGTRLGHCKEWDCKCGMFRASADKDVSAGPDERASESESAGAIERDEFAGTGIPVATPQGTGELERDVRTEGTEQKNRGVSEDCTEDLERVVSAEGTEQPERGEAPKGTVNEDRGEEPEGTTSHERAEQPEGTVTDERDVTPESTVLGERDVHGESTPPRDLATEAHARRSDPATSHAAARSIPFEKLRASQQAVYECFMTFGPMHHDHLADVYESHREWKGWPVQSMSGLRTRTKELVAAGWLRASGRTVTLASGRSSIVWTHEGTEKT